MIRHSDIDDKALLNKIKKGIILIGGNSKLKIYGKLSCKSGKRMRRENRVFFKSISESEAEGYRPCGHCMRSEYKKWNVNNHK